MKNFKNNWLKVLEVLSNETTEVGYSTWFVPITPIRVDNTNDKIYLDPFSELNLNILAARYLPLLENAIFEVFKKGIPLYLNLMMKKKILLILGSETISKRRII